MNRAQLLAHLIRSGLMTKTGVSRKARVRPCSGCRAAVVVGLDGDMCAFEVACDPTPLSTLGEALAVLEGRRTLALHRAGGRWELDWRDHIEIADHPASSTAREDVLRQHRCGDVDQPEALTAPSQFAETAPSAPDGANPPF